MDRWIVASATLAVALVAVGIGIWLANDPIEPPCPEGMSPTPDGTRCVSSREACNAWFRSKADERVSCDAVSKDGDGTLRFALGGTGLAEVRVLDGAGKVAYERAVRFDGGLASDVRIQGAAGTWRLEVRFVEARGSGEISLWG